MNKGEDFVTFELKPAAPDFVAVGRPRYAAEFKREDAPFRATRAEWKVYLAPTGHFAEVIPEPPGAAVPPPAPPGNSEPDKKKEPSPASAGPGGGGS